MEYDFDTPIDRTGTSSMKWQKYENTDILPMWVADMDFNAPPEIILALKNRLSHGIFGYTLVPDIVNQIIVERMAALYQWQIQTDWILWVPGVVSGLNIACRSCGQPSDAIVTTTPIYPPFLSAPSHSGRPLVSIPMREVNNRATFDFDRIETAFKNGASLILLCSPYNPCGTLFTKSELETLVNLCNRYDVNLCSDEIHSDFVLDDHNRHIPTATISDAAADRTITLMAPSKTYNIPGLGASFAVIPNPELRNAFKRHSAGIVPDVNLLGFTATQAAYEKCDSWLEQLIRYLKTNRDRVVERVRKMDGCRINPIDATYLAWIDVRDLELDDPVGFFEAGGVGLSDGKYFGQKGFVRLNFGCPASLLETGLTRMENALSKR